MSIPPKLQMTLELVPNVFEPDKIERRGIVGKEQAIPSRILNMHVQPRRGFRLRAIVVFEHRNLDFASEALEKYTNDVIIVQVSHKNHSSTL